MRLLCPQEDRGVLHRICQSSIRRNIMDFTFDPKQKELVELAREISQKEIAPRALEIDNCWRF